MLPDTQAVIDAFWAEYFGCSAEELGTPGIRVVPHVGMAGYAGAFFFRHGARCLVSVPPALLETTTRKIQGRAVEELFEMVFLRRLFGSAIERTIGPAWLGYTDATDFRPWPAAGVRLLEPEDEAALRRLAAACDATEWEHSGLQFDRPPVCGCFREEEMVSAAGYELWGERLAHIGVVTHPAHRGSGYGKAVVSGIAEHALRQGLISQYRTLQSNGPSLAIGRVLGFREYAVTLAMRFREMPEPGSSAS